MTHELPPEDEDEDYDPFAPAVVAQPRLQAATSTECPIERLARRGMLPRGIAKQLRFPITEVLEALRELPAEARAAICSAWLDRLYEGSKL